MARATDAQVVAATKRTAARYDLNSLELVIVLTDALTAEARDILRTKLTVNGTASAEALSRFAERFGTSEAADAYGRRMECDDIAALVPLLASERARESWQEAHREDCEDGCGDTDR